MAYAKSELIKVFPTSNRGTVVKDGVQKYVDPEARLNTEGNLTGILKHITDEDSFILNATKEGEAITSIEFIINGYYFKLIRDENKGQGETDLLDNKDLWASITVSESGTTASGYAFNQLNGTDNDDANKGKYTGISFDTSEPASSNNTYTLQLLSNSEVPFDKYIKFKTNNNFRSVYIDDGDLD